MLDRIRGKHQISNVDLCFQGTCNTSIDHTIHSKTVCQDLHAQGCADFADSGLNHNHLFFSDSSLIKLHTSHGYNLRLLHFLLQLLHFRLHGTDNS